jgi:vancomycin resistance protein VanJ
MTTLRWGGPILLLLTLLVLWGLGDRWWGALPLLYGPRWPLVLLVPLPLLTMRHDRRRALIATAIGALLVLLVLDVRLPWRALFSWGGGEQSSRIVIVEWNAQGGGDDVAANVASLMVRAPAAMVISECRSGLASILSKLDNYSLHAVSDACLITNRPVIEWSPRDPSDFWRAYGSGAIGRLVIDVDGREVVLGGVHLETPREALEELFFLSLGGFIRIDAEKREIRDLESQAARAWIAPPTERRPVIVAGDFNLPVESAIYRRWWGDLTNAFSSRGAGLGWTKVTRLFGVRIDHILVGNGVAVESIVLGDAMGSDHRPVIATLRIPPATTER